jgi:ribonuclease BN (tRNA processing enzyme)
MPWRTWAMRPLPDQASDANAPLRLTVIGCAAAWSTHRGRASSCYLIQLRDEALVLDLGQGAFGELAARLDPAAVRAVLISHAHPDHCVDLIPMRHYLKYGRPAARGQPAAGQRAKPPTLPELYGPVDLPARFDDFLREPHFLAPFQFRPLVSGSFHIGPFDVTAERVTHADRSFAFRVARARRAGDRHGPPGLVYSGDCGDPADLASLIRPGDTLLAEALWGTEPGEPEAHHLDAAAAATAGRDGQAARLILTHFHDGADTVAARRAARAVFTSEVLIARPGLVVEV